MVVVVSADTIGQCHSAAEGFASAGFKIQGMRIGMDQIGSLIAVGRSTEIDIVSRTCTHCIFHTIIGNSVGDFGSGAAPQGNFVIVGDGGHLTHHQIWCAELQVHRLAVVGLHCLHHLIIHICGDEEIAGANPDARELDCSKAHDGVSRRDIDITHIGGIDQIAVKEEFVLERTFHHVARPVIADGPLDTHRFVGIHLIRQDNRRHLQVGIQHRKDGLVGDNVVVLGIVLEHLIFNIGHNMEIPAAGDVGGDSDLGFHLIR